LTVPSLKITKKTNSDPQIQQSHCPGKIIFRLPHNPILPNIKNNNDPFIGTFPLILQNITKTYQTLLDILTISSLKITKGAFTLGVKDSSIKSPNTKLVI
jgi:hypothetical protein